MYWQLQVADTSIYTCADVQNIRRSHERGVKLRGDSGPYERIVGFNLLVTEYYVRGYLLNTLRQIRREAGSFEKYLQVSAIGKLVKKYAVHVPRAIFNGNNTGYAEHRIAGTLHSDFVSRRQTGK